MPISILCPSCKKNLKAPDNAGGKRVKCPQCGTGISLPTPPVVEEPFPPAMPVRRPTKQGNHVLVFLVVGVAVAGIAGILIVLAVGGFLWGAKGNEQAVVKAQPKKPADEKSGNKTPPVKANADDSKSALDTKRKEELAKLEKEKAEKARLEEERKQTEEAIRNAAILQAPPLEKGKYHETGDFGKMMKDLADNEFKFREGKAQVYRSTFNQRTLQTSPILKRFHARNAVVTPGRYDFDSGSYFLDLVFWQALYMEKKKPADVVNNPRTERHLLVECHLQGGCQDGTALAGSHRQRDILLDRLVSVRQGRTRNLETESPLGSGTHACPRHRIQRRCRQVRGIHFGDRGITESRAQTRAAKGSSKSRFHCTPNG